MGGCWECAERHGLAITCQLAASRLRSPTSAFPSLVRHQCPPSAANEAAEALLARRGSIHIEAMVCAACAMPSGHGHAERCAQRLKRRYLESGQGFGASSCRTLPAGCRALVGLELAATINHASQKATRRMTGTTANTARQASSLFRLAVVCTCLSIREACCVCLVSPSHSPPAGVIGARSQAMTCGHMLALHVSVTCQTPSKMPGEAARRRQRYNAHAAQRVSPP